MVRRVLQARVIGLNPNCGSENRKEGKNLRDILQVESKEFLKLGREQVEEWRSMDNSKAFIPLKSENNEEGDKLLLLL